MREILTRVSRLALSLLTVFQCCLVLTLWPAFFFLSLYVPCPVHLFVLHLGFKLKQQLLLRQRRIGNTTEMFFFWMGREGSHLPSFNCTNIIPHGRRERESEKEKLMTRESVSLLTIPHNFSWSREFKPVFMKISAFKHRQQHARTAPIKNEALLHSANPFFGELLCFSERRLQVVTK